MNSRFLIVLGTVLALLGAGGFILERVEWSREETVVDVGPLQASTTVREGFDIPPAASGGVLAAGLVLLGLGFARRP